jgi:hypothetical protein
MTAREWRTDIAAPAGKSLSWENVELKYGTSMILRDPERVARIVGHTVGEACIAYFRDDFKVLFYACESYFGDWASRRTIVVNASD